MCTYDQTVGSTLGVLLETDYWHGRMAYEIGIGLGIGTLELDGMN